MKYLYKIFRLFFCPHKFLNKEKYNSTKTYKSGEEINSVLYIKECKYCGKIKTYVCS